MSPPPVLVVDGLRFGYRPGQVVVDVDRVELPPGGSLFVEGPSGSGKTTLLGLLTGVLPAPPGTVRVLGHDLGRLSPAQRDSLRGERMGYVFQLFNLIPYLSVEENILLPCRISRRRRDRLGARSPAAAAREVAAALDIADCLGKPASEISVGQQQRVAAARALLGDPELVIADEPTSALDADRRQRFLDLLLDRCRASGTAVVLVSHDAALRPFFEQVLRLDEKGSREAA